MCSFAAHAITMEYSNQKEESAVTLSWSSNGEHGSIPRRPLFPTETAPACSHVSGSPFITHVRAYHASPATSSALGAAISVMTAGVPAAFTIRSRDAYGNRAMLSPGQQYAARATPMSEASIAAGTVQDGRFSVHYQGEGAYSASITATSTLFGRTWVEQALPGGLAATYYPTNATGGGDGQGADAPVPTLDWSTSTSPGGGAGLGDAAGNWTGGGARWMGYVQPRRFGGSEYTWSGTVQNEDGRIKLWLDGLLLVDQWSSLSSTSFSATSSFSPSSFSGSPPLYSLRVDYAHEGSADRGLSLKWTTAVDSTQPVPSSNLFYGVPLTGTPSDLSLTVAPAHVCSSKSVASGFTLLTAGVRSSFRLLSRDEYGNNRPPAYTAVEGGGLRLEAARASDGCPSWPKLSASPDAQEIDASPTFTTAGTYSLSADTVQGRGGLLAVIFSDPLHKSPVATRVDPQISFDWGSGTPHPLLPADTGSFGVRWTGHITAPYTGDYTLSTVSDSGASLTIGGVQLISYTGGLGSKQSSPFAMVQGILYPIELTYESTAPPAFIQLRWSSPPQVPDQAIPSYALFPPGTPLSNSPIALSISPAPIAPSLTTSRGNGLTAATAGKVTTFILQARDAFSNVRGKGDALAVKIENSESSTERFRHASSSSSFSGDTVFSYRVTKAGPHTVHAVSLSQGGLHATYYTDDSALSPASAVFSGTHTGNIDFSSSSGTQSLFPSLSPSSPFAVRWAGYVSPPFSAVYTLFPSVRAESSRIRLWVDNQLLVNQWDSLTATSPSASFEFGDQGAFYHVKIDYQEQADSM